MTVVVLRTVMTFSANNECWIFHRNYLFNGRQPEAKSKYQSDIDIDNDTDTDDVSDRCNTHAIAFRMYYCNHQLHPVVFKAMLSLATHPSIFKALSVFAVSSICNILVHKRLARTWSVRQFGQVVEDCCRRWVALSVYSSYQQDHHQLCFLRLVFSPVFFSSFVVIWRIWLWFSCWRHTLRVYNVRYDNLNTHQTLRVRCMSHKNHVLPCLTLSVILFMIKWSKNYTSWVWIICEYEYDSHMNPHEWFISHEWLFFF